MPRGEDEFIDAIRRFVESRALEVFTSMPGIVKSYDSSTQRATIQPATKRPLPTSADPDAVVYEALPELPDVPIVFPRSGGCSITMPVNPGDGVLLVFSSYSPAGYRATGNVSDAGDVRPHHIGNAYAIPGVSPDSETLAHATQNALVLESPTSILVGANATDAIAKAPNLETMLAQIDVDLQAMGAGLAVPYTPTFTVLPIAATKGKVE